MATPHHQLAHHRALARSRTTGGTARVSCDVCGVFEPDDTGRCPLCQIEHAGNLVDELRAQRHPR